MLKGTTEELISSSSRERLAQELAVGSFKEYGLQDGNTLEV